MIATAEAAELAVVVTSITELPVVRVAPSAALDGHLLHQTCCLTNVWLPTTKKVPAAAVTMVPERLCPSPQSIVVE